MTRLKPFKDLNVNDSYQEECNQLARLVKGKS